MPGPPGQLRGCSLDAGAALCPAAGRKAGMMQRPQGGGERKEKGHGPQAPLKNRSLEGAAQEGSGASLCKTQPKRWRQTGWLRALWAWTPCLMGMAPWTPWDGRQANPPHPSRARELPSPAPVTLGTRVQLHPLIRSGSTYCVPRTSPWEHGDERCQPSCLGGAWRPSQDHTPAMT